MGILAGALGRVAYRSVGQQALGSAAGELELAHWQHHGKFFSISEFEKQGAIIEKMNTKRHALHHDSINPNNLLWLVFYQMHQAIIIPVLVQMVQSSNAQHRESQSGNSD